jgi:three-Cys-motif partner protein
MAIQSFGGKWTEAKLTAVQKYLNAYVTLMRRNERAAHFTLTYLDGFAGSGRRYASSETLTPVLFSDFHNSETEAFYRGSPHRALEVEPPFDNYVFIESKGEYVSELRRLVADFPDRVNSVEIIAEDANTVIPRWCSQLKKNDRALVFLDPYGMQVDWTTVQAIAATQKIDLWVLVPLGQAIIRLLTAKRPPEEWARALTRFFGNDDWREHFYPSKQVSGLFGDEVSEVRDVDFDRIAKYIVNRFGAVFSEVLDEPLLLRNSLGVPIYLLCFAASNPVGGKVAVKIARDIARKLSSGK